MGELRLVALSPHPPLLIPDVGGRNLEKVSRTRTAMVEFARRVEMAAPDTVVTVSPHAPVLREGVAIYGGESLEGDFSEFGAPGVQLGFKNDLRLVELIEKYTLDSGLPAVRLERETTVIYDRLDYATLVPLYYLSRYGLQGFKLVSMGITFASSLELYEFGKRVAQAIEASDAAVVFVSSGDLSHRLIPGAPAGYDPVGKEFDSLVVECLRAMNVERLLNLDPSLVERAGECGLRPLFMALGALDGLKAASEVLSYEGPFGVGYAVALFEPRGSSQERRVLDRLRHAEAESMKEKRRSESFPVRLARRAVEEFVLNGRIIPPPEPIPEEFSRPAGAFCSIKKRGQLRGCIGTITPTQPNVCEEIMVNAIHAATRDPRFSPVTEDELDLLTYSVDILKPPEPVSGPEQLDPRRYGVIVRSGRLSGVLLPDLEGVDTADQQVEIARRKAGIPEGSPFELERFEVERYH